MKTPEEMAEEYAFKFYLNEDSGYAMTMNRDAFLAGYKAAQAIVEEEFKIVEESRVINPGLGGIYYALKIVLSKLNGD
jgi:thiaminase